MPESLSVFEIASSGVMGIAMQPFFIVNPALSVVDLQDALLEKFSVMQAIQSLLVFGCFDEIKLRVSEEVLCESLWAMADLLSQVEILHQELSIKVFRGGI